MIEKNGEVFYSNDTTLIWGWIKMPVLTDKKLTLSKILRRLAAKLERTSPRLAQELRAAGFRQWQTEQNS